jgi:hypothetical protein
MGDFTSRYSTHTEEKPGCYGEEDYYDITDSTCRACRYKGTCRIKVQAGKSGRSRDTPGPKKGHPTNGRSVPVPTEDPDEGDTFVSALTYNSSLNAATAMSETLTQALSGIPRKRYPSFRKRRKE